MNSKRKAEDIWLRIYMNKQQKKKRSNKKGKNHEKKVCHNFSEVDRLSDVSNGQSKIKMSAMSDNGFYNVKCEPYKYYEIQFKLDDSDELFKVSQYRNALPELYDYAKYTDKVVRICPECNRKFLVDDEKDRSVTCSDVCKKLRVQNQKRISYKKNQKNVN